MVPTRTRGTHVPKRGKNRTARSHSQSKFHHRYELLEQVHGADFSNTPLPHTTYLSAGGVAEIFSLNYMVWRLPWDRPMVAFSKAAFIFLRSTKRHLTSDNSCHTGSFGHANRAISSTSISLRDQHAGDLHHIYEPTR